jgi:predicted dehydrogenase
MSSPWTAKARCAILLLMRTINWGMIGCGSVTEVKSGPGFQKARNSRLVAVMRRDGAKAEDYARRHQVPRWYTQVEDLIQDPEVDAVYIATPPGVHLELALKVCGAGKPCYVEKPMALNFQQCQEMVRAFRVAGLPLFVAYYRRAFPKFLHIKQMIHDGAIGSVESIHLSYVRKRANLDPENLPWRYHPAISGGGLVADVGCHGIDILQFIFGPFEVLGTGLLPCADLRLREAKANIQSRCGDVPCLCQWRFHQPDGPEEDFVSVRGSNGRLEFSIFEVKPYTWEQADGRMVSYPFQPPEHVAQPLIQTVVDELNGVGTCPSTGETASLTNRVMDALYGNAQGGEA